MEAGKAEPFLLFPEVARWELCARRLQCDAVPATACKLPLARGRQ